MCTTNVDNAHLLKNKMCIKNYPAKTVQQNLLQN